MPNPRSRAPLRLLLASCLAALPAVASTSPPDAPASPGGVAPSAVTSSLSRVSLQKAVARAERQLRAVSDVLRRLKGSSVGPIGPALRDEYYGSYTSVLRAQGALRADAARFLAQADDAGEAVQATSGATAALALAVEQLRSIRESLVRNETPASRLDTGDAAVRAALKALQAAAAALTTRTVPAQD